MIASGLLATFLVYTTLNKSSESQHEKLEYYENLTANFLQNMSTWIPPADSRAFFEGSNSEATHWGDFDFIIVGAGSSGSVLLNRLTESGKFKVLVLEAGSYENDITDIPAFATYLMRSEFNWGYKTVPQTTGCLGMNERRCNFPRGKAVGGSSVINFMIYSRGNKDDFDEWAAAGNPGWDYASVLPYFKKSENSNIFTNDCEYHGHDGLLNVEYVRYNTSLTDIYLQANELLGGKAVDYNGQSQIGFSHVQSTTVNGKRCSGAKAFIKPVLNRQNLQLLDNSLVLKILTEDHKAVGVEFVRDGKKYRSTALKEVILSAGAINSPQILMLSGIGPRNHLQELNIPLVQHLPVGEILADHQMFFGLQFATNITAEPPSLDEMLQDYLNGQGVLTAAGSVTGIGFANNRFKSTSNPNIEYMFSFITSEQLGDLAVASLDITPENWSAISGSTSGKLCWVIIPELLHPKSVGTVHLKSDNPLEFPLIDLNMLSDPQNIDIEDMLNAIKYVFELSETAPFKAIDSQYLGNPLPACRNVEHLSDDYWKCALRQLTTTVYHPVATCKMGPPHDKTAVVDNELKVYGIESLRVIDASVIPFSTAAHTNAVSYMIGEKAADLIRNEYEN